MASTTRGMVDAEERQESSEILTTYRPSAVATQQELPATCAIRRHRA